MVVFDIGGRDNELESALQHVPLIREGDCFYIRGVDEPSVMVKEDKCIVYEGTGVWGRGIYPSVMEAVRRAGLKQDE
jgi:hypothetical protein